MINRDSFDASTLSAMDDAARFLHIHKQVLSMNATFKNARARGLSAKAAKPAAEKILRATKDAGCALMEASFSRDSLKIELARQRLLPELRRALRCAGDLARQERDAIPEIGENGVFRRHVELPLAVMIHAWAPTGR